jgi:hypothetical protein
MLERFLERMEMVRISAERRAGGMLNYVKDGPGAFNRILHPLQLEGQLIGNNVYSDERKEFHRAFSESGSATISFPARHHRFSC